MIHNKLYVFKDSWDAERRMFQWTLLQRTDGEMTDRRLGSAVTQSARWLAACSTLDVHGWLGWYGDRAEWIARQPNETTARVSHACLSVQSTCINASSDCIRPERQCQTQQHTKHINAAFLSVFKTTLFFHYSRPLKLQSILFTTKLHSCSDSQPIFFETLSGLFLSTRVSTAVKSFIRNPGEKKQSKSHWDHQWTIPP